VSNKTLAPVRFLCAGFGYKGDVQEPAPGGAPAETEQGAGPHVHRFAALARARYAVTG